MFIVLRSSWLGIKKMLKKIKKRDIKKFLYLKAEKGASESSLNLYLQSTKFVLENILGKRYFFLR